MLLSIIFRIYFIANLVNALTNILDLAIWLRGEPAIPGLVMDYALHVTGKVPGF